METPEADFDFSKQSKLRQESFYVSLTFEGSHKWQDHAVQIVELIEFDVLGPRASSYIVFPRKRTLLRQLVQAWGSSQVAGGQLGLLSWLDEDTDFFR